MYQQNMPNSSSYYGGDIMSSMPEQSASRQATDLGNDLRSGSMQWEHSSSNSPIMDDGIQFLSYVHPSSTVHGSENGFPLSLSPTLPSPSLSQIMSQNSPAPGGPEVSKTSPDSSGPVDPNKVTKRLSQNRAAQRRFRERREQEKTEILGRLEELSTENDKVSELLRQLKQKNLLLKSENERLESEVETLRRWRQKIMRLMLEIVQQEDPDPLATVSTSCSSTCWHRGIQRSRTFIIMQTLVSLFEEADGQSSHTTTISKCKVEDAPDENNLIKDSEEKVGPE